MELSKEQLQLGRKTIAELVQALDSQLNTFTATLKNFPKDSGLHVVVLNIVYTLGIEGENQIVVLQKHSECTGYDFETCKLIKKAFRGKDGSGRPITQDEIKIRNGRNFINENIKQLTERLNEYKEALARADQQLNEM